MWFRDPPPSPVRSISGHEYQPGVAQRAFGEQSLQPGGFYLKVKLLSCELDVDKLLPCSSSLAAPAPPATHSVSDKASTNGSQSVVPRLTASPENLLEMHYFWPHLRPTYRIGNRAGMGNCSTSLQWCCYTHWCENWQRGYRHHPPPYLLNTQPTALPLTPLP